MNIVFIVALIILILAHIFIIYKLYKNKKKVGSHSTLINFTLVCVLLLFIWLFHISIPYYILLLCMIALFLNSYVGYYLEYFWKSTKFDRYLHGYGIFSYTLLFYFIITHLIESGGTKLFHALFIVFLGISLGAIFEISEFRTDSKRNTRMQKGLKDTDFDIMFDIIGSGAAGLFAYFAIL
jgi:hypothetical protein